MAGMTWEGGVEVHVMAGNSSSRGAQTPLSAYDGSPVAVVPADRLRRKAWCRTKGDPKKVGRPAQTVLMNDDDFCDLKRSCRVASTQKA